MQKLFLNQVERLCVLGLCGLFYVGGEREKDYLEEFDDLWVVGKEKKKVLEWLVGENKNENRLRLTLSRGGTSSKLFPLLFLGRPPDYHPYPVVRLLQKKKKFPGKSFSSMAIREVSHLFSVSSKIVKPSASCVRQRQGVRGMLGR